MVCEICEGNFGSPKSDGRRGVCPACHERRPVLARWVEASVFDRAPDRKLGPEDPTAVPDTPRARLFPPDVVVVGGRRYAAGTCSLTVSREPRTLRIVWEGEPSPPDSTR